MCIRDRDAAVAAEAKAEKATNRARRMVALAGNPFADKKEATELAEQWLSDIKQVRSAAGENISAGEEKSLLVQECQLATWWHKHDGGAKARTLAARIYEPAKSQLGYGDSNFLSLTNTYLLSHSGKSAPKDIAEKYGDLVAALRQQKEESFEELLPQYAAALLDAGQDDEATKAIDEFLKFRNGDRPIGTMDKYRLDMSWSALKKWGKAHPKKLAQLKKLRSGEQLVEIIADKGSEQIWEGVLNAGPAKVPLRF